MTDNKTEEQDNEEFYFGGDPLGDDELGEDLGDPLGEAEATHQESVEANAAASQEEEEDEEEQPEEKSSEEEETFEEDTEEESYTDEDASEEEEDDADADEEGESGDAKLEDLPKEERDKRILIPKFRLDQSQAKLKEAEQELAALRTAQSSKAGVAPVQAEDITTRLAEHSKLIQEGEDDKAAALMATLLAETGAAAAQAAIETAASNTVQASADAEWNSTVSEIESLVPEMNPRAEEYDQNLVDVVGALANSYTKRMSIREALDTALATGLEAERPDIMQRLFPEQEDAQEAEQEEVETPIKKEKTKEKKKAAVEKNIDTSKKQPAPPAGSPNTSEDPLSGLDINEMSDEELFALPAATLARLQGNTV